MLFWKNSFLLLRSIVHEIIDMWPVTRKCILLTNEANISFLSWFWLIFSRIHVSLLKNWIQWTPECLFPCIFFITHIHGRYSNYWRPRHHKILWLYVCTWHSKSFVYILYMQRVDFRWSVDTPEVCYWFSFSFRLFVLENSGINPEIIGMAWVCL